MRVFLVAAMLGVTLGPGMDRLMAAETSVIPQTTVERYGLERLWFTQVLMDRGQSRIRDMVLYVYADPEREKNPATSTEHPTLYVQTSRALIHAIDAETGQTLWAKTIGRADHPSATPGVYRDLLATVNGSRVYVMNRYNGDILYETTVAGAPGAGAALSGKYVYVPTVTGMLLAYPVEPETNVMAELGRRRANEMTPEEKKAEREEELQNIRLKKDYIPPFACQAAGRALVQPLPTLHNDEEEYCVWPTDKGYLNIGYINRTSKDPLVIKYRLQTTQPILSQPTYLPPDPANKGDSGTIFAASSDGYVYAVIEKTGELLWKFSAAEPLAEQAVVIGLRVFACAQTGGLFCLDAKNGKQLWWAPDIVRFVAAGKQRIYAMDKSGLMRMLDNKSGSLIDTLPIGTFPLQVVNTQTDRIFVATETGLVQCLCEAEMRYRDEDGQVKHKLMEYGRDRWQPFEKLSIEPKTVGKSDKAKEGKKKTDDAPKAKPKPAPKAAKKKTAKADDADDAAGADDDAKAKPAKGKAAKGKAAKGKPKDDGGDNPFGG